MLGVDPDIGSSALRLWIAAGAAALLVFVCALTFSRSRAGSAGSLLGSLARVGAVAGGAGLGATLAWAFLNGSTVRDQGAERRAIELRAAALNSQAIAPGSALACLDALAGESVEAACEKALFATPASVASATSYIAARLALLADAVAYTQRGGPPIDGILLPLRRSLETDRFGFVAHTLATRDDCAGESCKALALLHEPGRVLANLSGQVFDRDVDRYAATWTQGPDTPVADAAPAPSPPGSTAQKKVLVDIDFPTAASIPAVSIMNPEPKGPVVPGAAAAAAATGVETNPQTASPALSPSPPSKRPRKQANIAPAQAPATAPQPSAAPADPVWSPGATLASPRPAANGSAPIQLSPPTQPEANLSTPAHTP